MRAVRAGVGAGAVGTAVMTLTTRLETALRAPTDHPVDYDVSDHVVTAAATVLRHRPTSATQRRALFLLVHWGYGSLVGVGYEALRARCGPVRATLVFYAGCQAMAWTLFPVLGGTPPPWRWRRDVLVSSLAQHLVYAAAVSVADTAIRERAGT